MDSRFVLLYFYYGGLIYGALGRLDDSLLMMQNVLCIPALLTSAIMIEAYKVLNLLSCNSHQLEWDLGGKNSFSITQHQPFDYQYKVDWVNRFTAAF